MATTPRRIPRMLIAAALFCTLFVLSTAASPAIAAPVDCSRGTNLSFEEPVININWTIIPIPGWATTDTGIEIWQSGFLGAVSPDGAQHAELQGNNNAPDWQDIPTLGGDQIEWSFDHRGRQNDDRVIVRLGSTATQTDEGDFTTGTAGWARYGGTYIVPDGQTTTRFVLDPVDVGSIGNLVDDVAFALTCGISVDSDYTGSTDTDSSGTVTAGDLFHFSYLVTNTGTATLTGVGVAETLGDPVTCDATTLTPGASSLCASSHAVTQGEIDSGVVESNAIASGTDAAGVSVDDTDVTQVPVVAVPEISLVKQGTVDETIVAPSDRTDAGDAIDYTFVVTNDGNVTVTSVAVTDPLIATVTCPGTPLAPGDSHTCTGTYPLTQDDIDRGDVLNTATASANPPAGEPVRADDGTTVTLDQITTLDITKAALSSDYDTVGDTLGYGIVVVNTGNTTLVDVAVADPTADGGVVECSPAQPAALLPGASLPCTATHTVTQADLDHGSVTNTASATAEGKLNGIEASDESDSIVVQGIQHEAISLTKTGMSIPVGDGTFDTTYELTVANSGNVTVHGLRVTDDLEAVFGSGQFTVDGVNSPTLTVNPDYDGATDIDLLDGTNSLAPGTTASIHLDITVDPDGAPRAYTNLATVLAAGIQAPLEATDTTDVAFNVGFNLTIDKSAVASVASGDDVSWTLLIGNTGPSAVLGPVTVTDALDDRLSFVSGSGEGWSCGHTHGTVTCTTADPLAAGASSVITIVTKVDASIGESVPNTASVVSADAANETDPSDNVATASVTVDSLPMTGFETADVAAIAIASILLGLGMLVATKPRRRRGSAVD
ncbi:MAG: hypothetical protein R2823_10850 [Acidimicrobiia bacterium]